MIAFFIMKYILVKGIFTENKYNQSAPEFYVHQGKATKKYSITYYTGSLYYFSLRYKDQEKWCWVNPSNHLSPNSSQQIHMPLLMNNSKLSLDMELNV